MSAMNRRALATVPVIALIALTCPPAGAWTHLGLEGHTIEALSSNGGHVFAVTRGDDFFERSLHRIPIDGGSPPELVWDGATGASAWAVACHPIHPDTVYLGLSGAFPVAGPVLLRSTDGGASFVPHVDGLCETQGGGVRSILVSATSPAVVTAMADDVVHTSVSSIGTWTALTGPEGCVCGVYCGAQLRIARGSAQPDRLWQVNESLCFGARIFQSGDGGASWSLNTEECSRIVTALEVDPLDANHVYLVIGPDRLRSTDGGDTWVPMPLPVSGRLAIEPADPRVLYAAAPGPTISRSPSRGATWMDADVDGLPASGLVPAMAADPVVPGLVFVAYGAHGIHADTLDVSVVGVSGASPITGRDRVHASSSPFRSATRLSAPWVSSGPTPEIGIYDAAGRRIASLVTRQRGQVVEGRWDGTTRLGSPAPAGVYYARIEGAPPAPIGRVVRLD